MSKSASFVVQRLRGEMPIVSKDISLLRAGVLVYSLGFICHIAFAIAYFNTIDLDIDWDAFLAVEISVNAPLWPLTIFSCLFGPTCSAMPFGLR